MKSFMRQLACAEGKAADTKHGVAGALCCRFGQAGLYVNPHSTQLLGK